MIDHILTHITAPNQICMKAIISSLNVNNAVNSVYYYHFGNKFSKNSRVEALFSPSKLSEQYMLILAETFCKTV